MTGELQKPSITEGTDKQRNIGTNQNSNNFLSIPPSRGKTRREGTDPLART
jgi:hypothetical protein